MNCSKCGNANPPGRKFCRQCGSPLIVAPLSAAPEPPKSGGTLCVQCGDTVPMGKSFCPQCGARANPATPITPTPPATPAGPPDGSIQAALARLGIRLSRRELIGLALSVAAGMVMARILPYIYPVLFGHLLDRVFGPGMSNARDGFNSHMMTVITFLSSFVISFFSFRKRRGA
jgi:RNA polymerase subunit RPABC4/transcription elongation factor Spt4